MAKLKLPHDIIVDTLSRLPVKSLLRFRCVSKPWDSLISNPQFIKTHLNRAIQDININRVLLSTCPLQSIDYEADDDDDEDAAVMLDYPLRVPESDFEIVGSCNGLVCLVVDSDNIILWNPSTRDAKELPKLTVDPDSSFNYGLVYDSSIDDYKVIRVSPSDAFHGAKIDVFTLKTNSWRMIQVIHASGKLNGSGTFFNGALHWLVRREIDQEQFIVIVSFDLVAEEFQEVVPLPNLDSSTSFIQKVCVLAENFAALCFDNNHFLEIWVMKEYGAFTISGEMVPLYEDWLSPLCLSKNDEILMDIDGRELVMYNPKEETFRNLKIHGEWDWFETAIYVESLVSPNNNGETDEQRQAQP